MTTYIFPGQGSQVKGMGKDLFTQFPELVLQANEVLGYSIMDLCLEDARQELNQTQYTQPALYVVNALTYLHKLQTTNEKPHYLAGHSLGEYNALFAAEVFDFATGLKLVKKRGELMSKAENGGMLAVVGLTADTVKEILAKNNLHQVSIANYNSHTQMVISGAKNEIDRALPLFEAAGALMVMPLRVSGAFHSPLMQGAQTEFAQFLASFSFANTKIPVIANVNAKPYQAHEVQKNLTEQISNPVRWTESIEYLMAQGEETFEEIGPGKILTGLVRRIKMAQ